MIIQILDHRLLYFNPGTTLDALKLSRFFEHLDHLPAMAAGRLNRLTDFSSLTRVEMDDAYLQSVSEIRGAVAEYQQPYKVALFSDQPFGLRTAQMYAAFFLSQTVQLRAMDNLDEALAWLGAADLKETILQLQSNASA